MMSLIIIEADKLDSSLVNKNVKKMVDKMSGTTTRITLKTSGR